ncbi:MAG: RnfH family protein [Pseudomonadota bacterium]
MADIGFIKVQVCYATEHEMTVLDLQVPAGATLSEAVTRSGILQKHPEIDIAVAKFGIYGKLKSADSALHEGDRVEIYRPLIADPKESRRRRADKQKGDRQGA